MSRTPRKQFHSNPVTLAMIGSKARERIVAAMKYNTRRTAILIPQNAVTTRRLPVSSFS